MSQDRTSWRAHTRATLALGLPLIGGQLAQFGIHMTDVLMLGRYDLEAAAAAVLASTFFFVLFIVGSGFGAAVMPMVAAADSAGDDTAARRVTRMGLWLSMIYCVIALPALLFSEPLFLAMGQEAGVSRDGGAYLRIAGWGLLAALPVVVLRSYLSALDRAGIVMWVTIATLVLNILVNYALIFGNWGAPELGIRGAAIASVIVQVVTLLGLGIYAAGLRPAHQLFVRFWRPDWQGFADVFRLGWPIGLTSLAEVGLFAASTAMMGWISALALAAHGFALQIASAVFMIHLGLSQAATVRAGQAFGRRDEAALRRGGWVATGLSGAVAVLTAAAFLIWPEPMIGAFVSQDDPDRMTVIGIGVGLLAAAALFQLADAAQVMALGLLRGVQDTRAPMILATISYWGVGLPVSYALGFPLGWGGIGIWLGLALGLAVAAVLMLWRFWARAVHISPT